MPKSLDDQTHIRFSDTDRKTGPGGASWQRAIPLIIVLLAPLVVGGWPVVVSGWLYFYPDKDDNIVADTDALDPPLAPVTFYEPVAEIELASESAAPDIALFEESAAKSELDAHAEELTAIITKARDAVAKKALTTPAHDNAAKWAEEALQLDPQNKAAHEVLYTVIDTYLKWTSNSLERRRLRRASIYLQRAQTLEDHASAKQLAAINTLSKRVSSKHRHAKHRWVKHTRSIRYGANQNAAPSAAAWLEQLDRDMENLGRRIKREASTFGQNTVPSREQGFAAR